MARWADQTCGGIACVRRLAGNVGYLDLQPVLFPAVMAGELITAAMTLLATADALIIDLRRCLGGEPAMVSFLISYLWDHEPAQLSGLREHSDSQPRQAWTLPYVPGRRPGKATRPTCSPAPPHSPGASSSATICNSSAGLPSSASAPAAAPTPARDSASTPTWRPRLGRRSRPPRKPAPTGREPASHPRSRPPPPRPAIWPRLALQDVVKAGGDAAAESQHSARRDAAGCPPEQD